MEPCPPCYIRVRAILRVCYIRVTPLYAEGEIICFAISGGIMVTVFAMARVRVLNKRRPTTHAGALQRLVLHCRTTSASTAYFIASTTIFIGFIAECPAPVPHLANPEECAALRIVLVTVPRVSRSCEHCLRDERLGMRGHSF